MYICMYESMCMFEMYIGKTVSFKYNVCQCMYFYTYVCMYVYMYMCMHACMYVCI